MRKWRLTEINAPTWVVILPGLGQAPWWAQGSNGQVECGQGDPFTLFSRALETPIDPILPLNKLWSTGRLTLPRASQRGPGVFQAQLPSLCRLGDPDRAS